MRHSLSIDCRITSIMRHAMRFAFQLETPRNCMAGGAKEIPAGGLISTPMLNLYAKQLGEPEEGGPPLQFQINFAPIPLPT
jgi:hypothetical protein